MSLVPMQFDIHTYVNKKFEKSLPVREIVYHCGNMMLLRIPASQHRRNRYSILAILEANESDAIEQNKIERDKCIKNCQYCKISLENGEYITRKSNLELKYVYA